MTAAFSFDLPPHLEQLWHAWVAWPKASGLGRRHTVRHFLADFGDRLDDVPSSLIDEWCEAMAAHPQGARTVRSALRSFYAYAVAHGHATVDPLGPRPRGRHLATEPPDCPPVAAYLRAQTIRGLSPKTLKRRAWTLHSFARAVGPDRILTATLDDVEEFVAGCRTAESRRSRFSDLHVFFQWAIRRDLTDRDPTAKLDPPRLSKRLPTPVGPKDVRRALAALPEGSCARLATALAAYAGLRVSEIAGLHVDHIDRQAHLLTVRNGKGGKDRQLPISTTLAAELDHYAFPAAGAVFPGLDGPAISYRIRTNLRALGIRHRPHDLRASFATQVAAASNGNVIAVSQLMGHADVATSMRYVGYRPELAGLVEGLYEDQAS